MRRGRHPQPRRRWVQPGKRRTVPYLGDHIRQNVIFSLIVDGVNTDIFQFFLDAMAKAVPKKEGVRQLLILDNASGTKPPRELASLPAEVSPRLLAGL